MLSIQQLIRALRKLQSGAANNSGSSSSVTVASVGDLMKSLAHMNASAASSSASSSSGTSTKLETQPMPPLPPTSPTTTVMSSSSPWEREAEANVTVISTITTTTTTTFPKQQHDEPQINSSNSSQRRESLGALELSVAVDAERARRSCSKSNNNNNTKANGSWQQQCAADDNDNCDVSLNLCAQRSGLALKKQIVALNTSERQSKLNHIANGTLFTHHNIPSISQHQQNLYRQLQQRHIHTQSSHQQQLGGLCTKQKQTQFAMSSLAAPEPLAALKPDNLVMPPSTSAAPPLNGDDATGTGAVNDSSNQNKGNPAGNCSSSSAASPTASAAAAGKPCFNTGLGDILQFMELIGNLKHTKRTGWVLRDVNDCESISGHMYRMSMMTFLLDGTEGLNQIRCMELALVHDLAESLVGDITPFCGVSKTEKRAMEFKAMEDICKLIEPRGKRIMELFEEYEHGESAESKFVKDLDRLDMVMQAFEYEKRDNCLLKHQEFFDSTEGKFNHPFVKKLVNEIYEQRKHLAADLGAIPPPPIHIPNMDLNGAANGHCSPQQAELVPNGTPQEDKHTSSSTSS